MNDKQLKQDIIRMYRRMSISCLEAADEIENNIDEYSLEDKTSGFELNFKDECYQLILMFEKVKE